MTTKIVAVSQATFYSRFVFSFCKMKIFFLHTNTQIHCFAFMNKRKCLNCAPAGALYVHYNTHHTLWNSGRKALNNSICALLLFALCCALVGQALWVQKCPRCCEGRVNLHVKQSLGASVYTKRVYVAPEIVIWKRTMCVRVLICVYTSWKVHMVNRKFIKIPFCYKTRNCENSITTSTSTLSLNRKMCIIRALCVWGGM